jgi:3-deoxy-D-manno-octulosonate 8-phosphate phosphatase (KDO 8-P phosphatase)
LTAAMKNLKPNYHPSVHKSPVETTVIEKLTRIKLICMDVDGTFTDGILYYNNEGTVIKGFSARDGLGLELLHRAGVKHGFITGRYDNATEARITYLGADFYLPEVGNKGEAFQKVLAKFGIVASESLFMGDDLNDLSAFEVAGVSVAVANAHEEVKKRADFVTKSPGGHGAVREVVDLLLTAQGFDPVALWMSDSKKTVGKRRRQ